jgi:hypothetical protein
MPTTPFLLSSYTAPSNVSSIAINSINQTYTDLWITLSTRGNWSDQWAFDSFQINGITTSTYSITSIRGYVGNVDYGNTPSVGAFGGGYSTGGGSEANSFGCGYIYITNYANASVHKNIRFGNYNTNNNATSYNNDSAMYWANNAAVSSLLFTPINGNTLFMQNSQINVYGI